MDINKIINFKVIDYYQTDNIDNDDKLMLPPPSSSAVTNLNKNDLITILHCGKPISLPRKIIIDQNSIRNCDSNGIIFSAYNSEKKERIIVKKVSAEFFFNRTLSRRFVRDLQYKSHLAGHPNIVRGKQVFKNSNSRINSKRFRLQSRSNNNDMYIVSDFPHTTLYQLVRQGLNEAQCKFLFYQILTALKYIHSAGIIHRNLDTKSIMVDKDYTLKISDFGHAYPVDSPIDLFLNDYETQWSNRSPESIVLMKNYTTSMDIWSAGCIFGEMLLGKTLFDGTQDHTEQLIAMSKLIGTPNCDECYLSQNSIARDFILHMPIEPKGVGIKKRFSKIASPAAIEILEGMLCFDPSKRWTLDQVINHQYFKDNSSTIYICPEKFDLNTHLQIFKLAPNELKNLIEREFKTHQFN